jgi:dephospho-CoA kinase
MYDRIGVCGFIGSGKTHVAKLIATTFGYDYLSSDLIFKEDLLTDEGYRQNLTDFLGVSRIQPFVDGIYQTDTMSNYLFSSTEYAMGFPNVKLLNAFNAPFVYEALKRRLTNKCVIEMATLTSFAYVNKLDLRAVILVEGRKPACFSTVGKYESALDAVRRDQYRPASITENIYKYQRLTLASHKNLMHLSNITYNGDFCSDVVLLERLRNLGTLNNGGVM